MLRPIIAIATFATLCSCDQPQPSPSQQLSGDETPRPGVYEVSQLQRALDASASPTPDPTVSRVCVSAVDAQNPEAMIGGPQLDGCPERHVTLRDGHIDLEYRCVEPTGSITGSGTYSSEGWEVAVDLSAEGQSIRFEEKSQRIGDC